MGLHEESDLLNKLVELEIFSQNQKKADSSAGINTDVLSVKVNIVKTTPIQKMSSFDARKARRAGKFVKVAGRNDLYQEVETNDFWKISDNKDYVYRTNEKDVIEK